MTEVVANLVRNGIRFTPDGGTVEVSALREGSTLVIDVTDSGIGISEDQARVLFDPAVMIRDSKRHHSSDTLEFNSEGLGLGLSIARGIVEFHGGTIEVKSALGRGSRFRVRIPIDAARRDRSGEGEARRPRRAVEVLPPVDPAALGMAAPTEEGAGRRAAGSGRPKRKARVSGLPRTRPRR